LQALSAKLSSSGDIRDAVALYNAMRSRRRRRRIGRGSRLDPLLRRFDTSGKSPAYLHHRKNSKARAGRPAAGFSLGLLESDGSRGRIILLESASRKASRRAAVRALFFPTRRILKEKAAMTAYLISLSLLGLVAIAVWDGFS
jgi:hypothetical protein